MLQIEQPKGIARGDPFGSSAASSAPLRGVGEFASWRVASVDSSFIPSACLRSRQTTMVELRELGFFMPIDPARKEWHCLPPIPAKNAGMDGAPAQYLVAGSIASGGALNLGRDTREC